MIIYSVLTLHYTLTCDYYILLWDLAGLDEDWSSIELPGQEQHSQYMSAQLRHIETVSKTKIH